MIKLFILTVCCVFGLYLGSISSVYAAPLTVDSKDSRLYSSTQQPMTQATVTVLINVSTPKSPVYSCTPGRCNFFVNLPSCPPGSVPFSPSSAFTGDDAKSCDAGNCTAGLSHQGPSGYGGTITASISCLLTLQGWFLASEISSFIPAGQTMAPISNFSLTPYSVIRLCGPNGCACSASPNNGLILGYPNLCNLQTVNQLWWW